MMDAGKEPAQWPCRMCEHFSFHDQGGGPNHGHISGECAAPGHNYLLLASDKGEDCDDYRPRTELGRKLLDLRRAYVASGGKLLNDAELDAEIKSRR